MFLRKTSNKHKSKTFDNFEPMKINDRIYVKLQLTNSHRRVVDKYHTPLILLVQIGLHIQQIGSHKEVRANTHMRLQVDKDLCCSS